MRSYRTRQIFHLKIREIFNYQLFYYQLLSDFGTLADVIFNGHGHRG